jgi:hypothetical protein
MSWKVERQTASETWACSEASHLVHRSVASATWLGHPSCWAFHSQVHTLWKTHHVAADPSGGSVRRIGCRRLGRRLGVSDPDGGFGP